MHNFNPLAPCGARLIIQSMILKWTNFNPLAPCGARPLSPPYSPQRYEDFNPLAPCGARPVAAGSHARTYYFNPLAPCGARQQTVIKTVCKGRSYCTDHLLISPTKGTFSRKKNHPDGKTAYLWCEPIRDLV